VRFRTRLLLIFALTTSGVVALVTGAVSVLTRRAFDRIDNDRRAALLAQFQQRLADQGEEVARRVERVAASREILRIAIDASQRSPDFSTYFGEAQAQAEAASLDYLDILRDNRTIISSAHWPARFNYANDWLAAGETPPAGAFLTRVPRRDGADLALVAFRTVKAGDAAILVAGGKRVDEAFLESLGAAPGIHAILVNVDAPVDTRLKDLVSRVESSHHTENAVVPWSSAPLDRYAVAAMPLERAGHLLGVLAVATSLAEELALERWILWVGVIAGVSGIILGVLTGWWVTERVTRPVEELARGARAVASGDWETHVAETSRDEIGELARAFNRMTEQLIEQRERAIQAERVAAWRELARRLAHELKNPLFPLQITVENLRRAREQTPGEFDEVFRESTDMLLGELGKLRAIIGRFSDFAKMPQPELQQVDANACVAEVMRLFDAQIREHQPPITTELDLDKSAPRVSADPEQLGRALRNLVLNAMDAMPQGGRLSVRTRALDSLGGGARIEVSDTGQGLTAEECSRLFTPYYTTKQHGTGLGLAIVQSVVSDHKGRIWVESTLTEGATFIIELPANQKPECSGMGPA